MTKKDKKKKKLKNSTKIFFRVLIIFILLSGATIYLKSIPTKNIYIKGTTLIEDVSIIEITGIKDYPPIYSLNKKKMIEAIKTLPLVSSVKIKRSPTGRLTIDITEEKILFYYKYNNKYVLSNGTFIEDQDNFFGYASLINFTPDVVFEDLTNGLKKIDYSIIRMIDEITYTPYKTADGTIIDEGRFTLKMNDGNEIIIDTVNIRKLNNYFSIYASLGMDITKGTLYLDTITEDNVYFKSFATQEKEALEAQEKQNEENVISENIESNEG